MGTIPEKMPPPEEKPTEIKDPPANSQAHTPEPETPEREDGSPGKIPVRPPSEPPDPNPVHVPTAPLVPGDLPGSNPDVISKT